MMSAPPAPVGPGTAAPAQKPKGVRLKNVALTRPGDPPKLAPAPAAADSVLAEKKDETPSVRAEETPKAEEPKTPAAADPKEKAKEKRAQIQGMMEQGCNRNMMLKLWKCFTQSQMHTDLGYRAASRDVESPGDMWRIPPKDRQSDKGQSWREGMGSKKGGGGGGGGAGGTKTRGDKEVLKPGANAYKIQKANTRESELTRDARALLNKICPENKERIIERFAQIQIDNESEMEVLINIIFTKVMDDPHYCETYVDMIHALNKAYPEFPPTEEGDAPKNFRRLLINMTQDKFEDLMAKIEDEASDEMKQNVGQEDMTVLLIKSKRQAMATMKFIGHLFVRQLLAAAVIRRE